MYQTQVETKTKTKTKTMVAVALVTLAVGGAAMAGVLISRKSISTSVPTSAPIATSPSTTNSGSLATTNAAGPKITALSVTPTTINTATADQTLVFTLGVKADPSGLDAKEGQNDIAVTDGKANIIRSYKFLQKSGDAKQGIYTISIVVPKNSPGGTWSVYDISLRDKAGNYKSYYYSDLKNAGFGNLDIINKDTDTVAPDVHVLSISPTTINTASQDQTLKLSLTVTDNVNAGDGSRTQLRIANGSNFVDFTNFVLPVGNSSGFGTYVTYTATAVVPRGSASGTWKVSYLKIFDQAGNEKDYSYNDLASGYNTGLNITNTPQ